MARRGREPGPIIRSLTNSGHDALQSSSGAVHACPVRLLSLSFAHPTARGAAAEGRGAMMAALHYLAAGGFAVLIVAAAFEDFRRFMIPNWLTLGICALWPLSVLTAPSAAGALGALACGFAVFVVGALLFARGYIGGGDVKLLAAVALWAGPALLPSLLIVTGLLGGVLALILLSPVGAYLVAGARAQLGFTQTPEAAIASTPVAYGIAIAAASLIVILPSQFS
jgi:prepilin peptidase CpaA